MPCVIMKKHAAIVVADGTATPQEFTVPLWDSASWTVPGKTKHRYKDPTGADATATYGVGEGEDQATTLTITGDQVDWGGLSGFANLTLHDMLNEAGPWTDLVTTSGDEAAPCLNAKTLNIRVVQSDGAGYWLFSHCTKEGNNATGVGSNKISLTFSSGTLPTYVSLA